MNDLTLYPGDLLSIPKNALITHRGVHLWGGMILQNTPEKGEHIVDFHAFSKGATVTVNRTNIAPELIARRLSRRLQKRRPYNSLLNNCEHTATAIIDGFAWSLQVVVGLVAIAVIIYILRKT